MLLIYGLLLMLMNERLLVECLLHILLTVTVLLTHCGTMLLLVMEIFHAVALAARQSLVSAWA